MTSSDDTQKVRPRRWFIEQGLLATGPGILMYGARFIGIDQILILWAGLADNSEAQDVIRYVFNDLMPVFLIVGGFGIYFIGRGLSIDGQSSRISPFDSKVAGFFGLLLVGYVVYLIL